MLPKSKSKFGYSDKEIKSICKKRRINMKDFNKAFGVNTCTVEDGESRYYKRDIENALYKLKAKDGIYHMWD